MSHTFAARGAGRVIAAATAACAIGLLAPASAGATSATATLTAGSLAFVSAPPAVTFSATLDGSNKTPTATQALDIGDATGSGAGWDITATSTTFSCCAGGHTLSTSATTIQSAPSLACDASTTCTTASNSITYPYTLPAGASAPTATKIYNAATNSGMGDQTVTPTWQLSVPASTFAGTYTSTWTLSLVSGP
jgi:WxL domain surface cell wall-binding